MIGDCWRRFQRTPLTNRLEERVRRTSWDIAPPTPRAGLLLMIKLQGPGTVRWPGPFCWCFSSRAFPEGLDGPLGAAVGHTTHKNRARLHSAIAKIEAARLAKTVARLADPDILIAARAAVAAAGIYQAG